MADRFPISVVKDAWKDLVYRLWAGDDLLYVGLTNNIYVRTAHHSRLQPWFPAVTHVSIEYFDTREEARAAELRAIVQESPRRASHDYTLSADDLESHLASIHRSYQELKAKRSGGLEFPRSHAATIGAATRFLVSGDFSDHRRVQTTKRSLEHILQLCDRTVVKEDG